MFTRMAKFFGLATGRHHRGRKSDGKKNGEPRLSVETLEPRMLLAAVVVSQGLVGYWALDETSGVVASDITGNGNDGTLVNGPVWTTGHVDNGLLFDGVNDYVNLGDPAELEGMNALTVSAWVNLDDLNSDAFIISDSGSNDSLGRYRLWFDDVGFKSGRTDVWSFGVHNGTQWYLMEGSVKANTG